MANIKRRGFLGMMAGAIASGPKLATGLTEAGLPPPSYLGQAGAGALSSAETDWKSKRIAHIKHLLSLGRESEDQVRERRRAKLYQAELIERFRLDSLRSVSPSMKAQMLVDGNVERSQRIRRLEYEDELERLLNPQLPL